MEGEAHTHSLKSIEDPGTLQEPAPHVMVFIPHTRVLTIPRQSATERGAEAGWEEEAEEMEAGGREGGSKDEGRREGEEWEREEHREGERRMKEG